MVPASGCVLNEAASHVAVTVVGGWVSKASSSMAHLLLTYCGQGPVLVLKSQV